VRLIDAAPAVARQAARVLNLRRELHPDRARAGRVAYATTSDRDRFAELLRQLGLPPGEVSSATD